MSPTPLPCEEDLQDWVEPDLTHSPPETRSRYEQRRAALCAVVHGASLTVAARQYQVTRTTLSRALLASMERAPDGKPWGWRACVPYRTRTPSHKPVPAGPTLAGPGALGRLLRAYPELSELLANYSGALPTRERRSKAFERFFARFLTEARRLTPWGGYPFNASDHGRRSVLRHLRDARRQLADEELVEPHASPEAGQCQELFAFGVMERLEFDAHRMDVDLVLELERANGVIEQRHVGYVWLLLLIDSASRLILAARLVYGRGYSQVDVLRIFRQALLPWEPGELLVPGMQYVAGSGVGTMPACGRLLRGVLTALDNALSHHATLTSLNLLARHRGVMNFGRARVPETRAVLEALFRLLENAAIRKLPGGYEPARDHDTPKRATTCTSAADYPLNPVALSELLDVVVASSNVTPRTSLGDQSPLDVVRRYATGSSWCFETSLTPIDADRLGRMRITVTVRGNRKKGRQPFVRFLRARYRAHGLRDRWDLTGKQFVGYVNMDDLRYITLLNERGEVFVKLAALPPWSRTRHDLDLRKLVIRCANRKLFALEGVDDAVEAYRRFVRRPAASAPAEQLARFWDLHAKPDSGTPARPDPLPRKGAITFDHVKDPNK